MDGSVCINHPINVCRTHRGLLSCAYCKGVLCSCKCVKESSTFIILGAVRKIAVVMLLTKTKMSRKAK